MAKASSVILSIKNSSKASNLSSAVRTLSSSSARVALGKAYAKMMSTEPDTSPMETWV